jgi:hypothetical protein
VWCIRCVKAYNKEYRRHRFYNEPKKIPPFRSLERTQPKFVTMPDGSVVPVAPD